MYTTDKGLVTKVSFLKYNGINLHAHTANWLKYVENSTLSFPACIANMQLSMITKDEAGKEVKNLAYVDSNINVQVKFH